MLRFATPMTSLTPRAIALLLALKVVLICSVLIYLEILPNPLELIVEPSTSHNIVGCTKEARVCPDGSYVGRVGPSCTFASCKERPLTGSAEEDPTTPPPEVPGDEPSPSPTLCTMDAKQCPDGSYVGRTGPNCEFTTCPTGTVSQSPITVQGTVMLGPTCPVERIPPEEACAPRPFEGAVVLTNTADGKSVTVVSDAQGAFTATFTRGVYSISRPENSSPFPSCSGKVEIASAGAPIPLFCDSGIR
ncbi:MAG: hypothetical protein RLZZ234_642 [Candidatus Parcubacteria bacterium]|jgi:hypothetical protein